VAALLLVLSAGVVQRLHLLAGNASTTVPAHQIDDRYHASTTTSVAGNPATTTTIGTLPTPGVYEYATKGEDSVDALNGAHHTYPATTTITVTPTACGVRQRWDVLVQRWEEWERCSVGSGISEPSRTTYDQFFGQSQTDVSRCSGAPRPLVAAAGVTWTKVCTIGSRVSTFVGLVIGTEQQAVGSSTVETMHVRITITDDTPSDRQRIDTWYLTGTDLVVAQTSTVNTSNKTQIGTVHYAEACSIRLASIVPRV
jgi:hypothetical protein